MLLLTRQLRFSYDPATPCAEHMGYLADIQRVGESAVREHLEHSTAMLLATRR